MLELRGARVALAFEFGDDGVGVPELCFEGLFLEPKRLDVDARFPELGLERVFLGLERGDVAAEGVGGGIGRAEFGFEGVPVGQRGGRGGVGRVLGLLQRRGRRGVPCRRVAHPGFEGIFVGQRGGRGGVGRVLGLLQRRGLGVGRVLGLLQRREGVLGLLGVAQSGFGVSALEFECRSRRGHVGRRCGRGVLCALEFAFERVDGGVGVLEPRLEDVKGRGVGRRRPELGLQRAFLGLEIHDVFAEGGGRGIGGAEIGRQALDVALQRARRFFQIVHDALRGRLEFGTERVLPLRRVVESSLQRLELGARAVPVGACGHQFVEVRLRDRGGNVYRNGRRGRSWSWSRRCCCQRVRPSLGFHQLLLELLDRAAGVQIEHVVLCFHGVRVAPGFLVHVERVLGPELGLHLLVGAEADGDAAARVGVAQPVPVPPARIPRLGPQICLDRAPVPRVQFIHTQTIAFFFRGA